MLCLCSADGMRSEQVVYQLMAGPKQVGHCENLIENGIVVKSTNKKMGGVLEPPGTTFKYLAMKLKHVYQLRDSAFLKVILRNFNFNTFNFLFFFPLRLRPF